MTVPLLALLPLVVADALLALWRPRVALLLPLVFHAVYVVRSSIPIGDFVVPTTFLELLLWVAIVGGFGQRNAVAAALRAIPKTVLAGALVFLLSATISAVIAPHPRTAWGQWKAFIVEPIAYAVALLPLLRAADGRRAIASALLLGGVVSAGLSVFAWSYCLLPTLPREALAKWGAYCPVTSDFGRLRGIYDVPNSLALVLAPLTAFAAVLAWSPEASTLRRLARWSLVLLVPTLLLTQSLGGLMSTVLALLLSVRMFPRKVSQYINTLPKRLFGLRALRDAILIVAIAVVGLLLQVTSGKLAHALAENSPLSARRQIWQVSLALIRDHPLLGTGLGTFEPAYQDKLHEVLARGNLEFGPKSPAGLGPLRGIWDLGFARATSALEWVVRDPHNVFLSFWLNTGLLGLLSMGTLVALGLRAGLRARSSPRVSEDVLPLASAAALLTLLLFGLVDVLYPKNDLSLLWWVYLTLLTPTFSLHHRPASVP